MTDLRSHPTPVTSDTEPTSGSALLPVWMVVLLGVVIYVGQLYLDENAGGFHPQVYQPYPSFRVVQDMQPKSDGDELFARGALLFKQNCEVCHMPHGRGDGVRGIPPLAGSDWIAGEGPNRVIRIVLHGLGGPITVSGQQFNAAMTQFRDILDDSSVASILTFERGNKEWGNNHSPVKPEQVKAIREATKDREIPWTAEELQKIPEKD